MILIRKALFCGVILLGKFQKRVVIMVNKSLKAIFRPSAGLLKPKSFLYLSATEEFKAHFKQSTIKEQYKEVFSQYN